MAEFDYNAVGTLVVTRYDEVEILYMLPDRIGNIYLTALVKKLLMSVADDARRIRDGLTALMGRNSRRSASLRPRASIS